MSFGPATRAWFDAAFEAPTPVQARGWEAISAGAHALLVAPTGSGKTLAAFLWGIDKLSRLPPDQAAERGVRVLYVSPLKALVYDVERNLRVPLVGIQRAAERVQARVHIPGVDVRTGDTPQKLRARQKKSPAEILVTTPESLYLLLGSHARETLRTVETVIIDEVHAVAGTKRGVHLALSLERLSALTEREPQRVGLSATVRPMERVARYLGGVGREVAIVDTSEPPRLDVQVVVPVADMERPELDQEPEPQEEEGGSILGMIYKEASPAAVSSIWPAIHPRLVELVQAHRSTIVFVNSRGLCERLAQALNELAGDDELVRAHHGSIAHAQRTHIEESLKSGAIKGIVATSSLELGIDMGAVDLVIQIESPGSVARGLQRVGRAGHHVGATSVGRIFPRYRGDLLECAVVAREMRRGHIESLTLPRNTLDVLAQHLVSMVAAQTGEDDPPWTVDAIEALIRRTATFAELSRDALVAVLDMLTGRYPSTEFSELRPRLNWDRERDVLTPRKGSKMLALVNAGTIPDRGLYAVHIAPDGPRVGELDEEMVHETRPGEAIILGATTWRVVEITRDRVLVEAASPGQPGKLPFWRGQGPGRPLELGRALGALVRDLGERGDGEAASLLTGEYSLDALAAANLVAYVSEQREATGVLPTDRAITIERFRDEIGDWRICILTPFGARVHAPWALAIEAALAQRTGHAAQALWSDDGIALRFADVEVDSETLPGMELLVPEPEDVEELLMDKLGDSALFASQFRENAARALLLPRRRPGKRTPLWAQRLKSQSLLAVAKRYPAFPIILETYRACLQDVFDLPALLEVLGQIRRRAVRVDVVETTGASPFSRSLVFDWVATYLYEGDAPLAERRAAALTLDRNLLRDLLGHDQLRELLDAEVLGRLEDELQRLSEDRRARHPDALHDLLRRLGDLREDELRLRCTEDPAPWLAELADQRRVAHLRVAGESRWIAAEDAGRYRDALGCVPPSGLPAAFLETAPAPLEELLLRYARTHGPFLLRDAAARFGLRPAQVEPVLDLQVSRGRLLLGEFRPGGVAREYCDPDVLRTLRRRTLAKLRGEVAPVDGPVLARFLPGWHGIGSGHRGLGRLTDILAQLEGLPLSFGELEGRILPSRMGGFEPRMLDELGAMGEIVWVGCGALGAGDGRVALYFRDRVSRLLEAPGPPDAESALHGKLLATLRERGACFAAELSAACEAPPRAELMAALWDLVWSGHVTNDTFQPLRELGGPTKPRRAGRRERWPGGRWSLVEGLLVAPPSPTERLHARASALLERHGVVGREVAAIEQLPGGFSSVYPVLKALEEGGRIRRGYFVEGLGGAQFAPVGAVDRLRAVREPADGDAPSILVLAATDPANPWGAVLSWPERAADLPTPRREAGARVALVDGRPAFYLARGHRQLQTFPLVEEDHAHAVAAAAALRSSVAPEHKSGILTLERVDGEPARTSRWASLLAEAGFKPDHRGLSGEADARG